VGLAVTDGYGRIDRIRRQEAAQTTKAEFADIDVFYAPAFPLRRAFSGIVNMHATVDRHDTLVLTDDDFGRAYLMNAWATRFCSTYSAAAIGSG